jgi:long-chain acyl-CoA synthetase
MVADGKAWFKMWPDDVPKTIEYPKVALHGLLKEKAKQFPQNVALFYGENEITYAQLDLFSNQFANALVSLGIVKGDRVALFLPNVPKFVIAFFGALKAGAVVTAISPLYKDREVEHQLSDSGAQTIVALDSLYPIIEKVREKTQLKHVIITMLDENAPSLKYTNALIFAHLLERSSKTAPKIKVNPTEIGRAHV